MKWFKKLFKRKKSLREKCVEAYGENFGKLYDNLAQGIPIGSMVETMAFLQMVDKVRNAS